MDANNEERPESITAYRRVIVSYDVESRRSYIATRVAQYVFGREVKMRTKSGTKKYRYEGLIAKAAAERLGQSVLIMREEDAEDFLKFLHELRVPCARRLVWAEY